MATVQKILTKIFGSRNERLLKRYRSIVAQINDFEPKVQPFSSLNITLILLKGLITEFWN